MKPAPVHIPLAPPPFGGTWAHCPALPPHPLQPTPHAAFASMRLMGQTDTTYLYIHQPSPPLVTSSRIVPHLGGAIHCALFIARPPSPCRPASHLPAGHPLAARPLPPPDTAIIPAARPPAIQPCVPHPYLSPAAAVRILSPLLLQPGEHLRGAGHTARLDLPAVQGPGRHPSTRPLA